MRYKKYAVSKADKAPLLAFVREALESQGCEIIKSTEPDEAPFRISFKTSSGERLGVICYAFLANQVRTTNRPDDEHRFQVKYGSKDGKLHRLWRDPFGLYTTLFVGINPEAGFFVAADPVIHSPTRFFISVEFKEAHAQAILKDGWHAWEREKLAPHPSEPAFEVLVGGRKDRFLDLVRFERLAEELDPSHRQMLAGAFFSGVMAESSGPAPDAAPTPSPETLHRLAVEFDMTPDQILDLISDAKRLKVAARGWVAEMHLVETLRAVDGVTDCRRLDADKGPDVELRYKGSRLLTVECKNAMVRMGADRLPRVDFQRTRASKSDPSSRYYKPDSFDMVAACLHSVTARWEFRYIDTRELELHPKYPGRIKDRLKVDARWTEDAARVLKAVSRR